MFPSSRGRDRQLPTGFKVSRGRAAGSPGQIWIAATQRSSQPAAKHVRLFLQWARCSLKLPLEKEEQQGKDTLHLKPKPTVWGRQVLWPSSPAWWLRESGRGPHNLLSCWFRLLKGSLFPPSRFLKPCCDTVERTLNRTVYGRRPLTRASPDSIKSLACVTAYGSRRWFRRGLRSSRILKVNRVWEYGGFERWAWGLEESFRGTVRTEAWRNEATHWMPTLTCSLVVMK